MVEQTVVVGERGWTHLDIVEVAEVHQGASHWHTPAHFQRHEGVGSACSTDPDPNDQLP